MIVKYSKKFPYAPYLNEDIGFEIELEDTEGKPLPQAIQVTLGFLKEMAEKFHKDNNPQLTDAQIVEWKTDFQAPAPLQSIDPKEYDKRVIATENAIAIAQTDEELNAHYLDAAKYGLMDLYNEKLKSLQ
jgi:hypothetical protein